MNHPFDTAARYYDKLYAWKDYAGEVELLCDVIRAHQSAPARTLLDVACGTGMHIQYLKQYFQVQGADISEELLHIARQRNPEVPFHLADMVDFDLGRQFDVVTCLFSSIGYAGTYERLGLALRSLARHAVPGGLVLVEPWFTPGTWRPNTVHALFIDEPDLKIARINTSFVAGTCGAPAPGPQAQACAGDGRLSWFDLHYLIGTPEGTEHLVEHHELGLFETDEMQRAMEEAGLAVEYDPVGPEARGLFIGQRRTGAW